MIDSAIVARMRAHLNDIYDEPEVESTLQALIARLEAVELPSHADDYLSQRSITLITYGDSLRRAGEPPLQTLHHFLRERLTGVIDTLHILPFYPWSSDDGFSVIDYTEVDSLLGTWQDIENLGEDFRLMFDAVINHMSAESNWFKAFLRGEPDFRRRFFVESPQADLSRVTRPRTSPLLTEFKRDSGETVHVWTTFSADQVDLDYRDPQTLLAILDVLLFYASKGARVIRLDAIAFMWKQAGTTSIHMPETHAIIRLLRAAFDAVAPQVTLITETNVPHTENISYFGDGSERQREAQLVYNFTLPPMLLHTLHTGNAEKLVTWLNTLQTPSSQTAFFNFTASHDGIGVRPVEGILSKDELAALIDLVNARGGRVSYRRQPDGTDTPYELNITYVDAIADPSQPIPAQVAKFLLSQGVMLAIAGVPAIYIHSLLGSRNDTVGMEQSGINRRINRAKLEADAVRTELDTPDSFRAQVFNGYTKMIRARRTSAAFHPIGAQQARHLNDSSVLVIERTSPEANERVLAVFNLRRESQSVTEMPTGVNLLTNEVFSGGILELSPYGMVWLRL